MWWVWRVSSREMLLIFIVKSAWERTCTMIQETQGIENGTKALWILFFGSTTLCVKDTKSSSIARLTACIMNETDSFMFSIYTKNPESASSVTRQCLLRSKQQNLLNETGAHTIAIIVLAVSPLHIHFWKIYSKSAPGMRRQKIETTWEWNQCPAFENHKERNLQRHRPRK